MRRFEFPDADHTPSARKNDTDRNVILRPLHEEMRTLRASLKEVLWRYAQFYRHGNTALEAMLEHLCEIEREYEMIGKEHLEQDDSYQTTLLHIVMELKDYEEVRHAVEPILRHKARLTRMIRRRTREVLQYPWN